MSSLAGEVHRCGGGQVLGRLGQSVASWQFSTRTLEEARLELIACISGFLLAVQLTSLWSLWSYRDIDINATLLHLMPWQVLC